jgi:uncharacterized protein YjiS (DUF1127 family)
MEVNSTIIERRMQGYAFIEGLTRLIAAGWRALSERLAAFAESQRHAQVRNELHHLSDHQLRDIGLDRTQINRLFR